MRFPVSPAAEKQLLDWCRKLGILEEDLEEKFIKGSGHGGQKINKTSSCVYLLHRFSGIEIKCQRGRSQAMNRFYARRELCQRLEQRLLGEKSKVEQEREKIRRQKKRRSRKQKEKMLKEKHERGKIKAKRQRPVEERE